MSPVLGTSSKPSALAGFFSEEREAYVLGLLRLALSALLFVNCGRAIQELQNGGYFGEFFHLPLWPEALVPSRGLYALLLAAEALGAVLGFLGLWPRGALLVSASIGLFVLGCDRLQYHNNRYALLLLGFLLAFTPCDRSLLIARRRPHTLPASERRAPTFARRLFQIQVSLVYLGSASGKLLDADWPGGLVLHQRFESVAPFWAVHGLQLPAAINGILTSAWFASLASKAAISTESFIAIGLWFPRTRRLALWIGVLFHFWIEVSARVELFSWVMGASYLAFVVPELRQRRFEYDPESALGRAAARALHWLDWCVRFEIVGLAPNAPGRAFRVLDREGAPHFGLAALELLAAATPLLFPTWLPLALLAKLSGRPASTEP